MKTVLIEAHERKSQKTALIARTQVGIRIPVALSAFKERLFTTHVLDHTLQFYGLSQVIPDHISYSIEVAQSEPDLKNILFYAVSDWLRLVNLRPYEHVMLLVDEKLPHMSLTKLIDDELFSRKPIIDEFVFGVDSSGNRRIGKRGQLPYDFRIPDNIVVALKALKDNSIEIPLIPSQKAWYSAEKLEQNIQATRLVRTVAAIANKN